MTVLFENECGMTFDFPMQEQLELLVQALADFTGCPYEIEVSVVLVDKDEIHRANREFRQVDRPTDVLSFPMMEYDFPAAFDGAAFLESAVVSPESNELVLGDIMLCAPIVREQAKEYGHSEIREFSFLVVHSLLHLFGYDHMEEAERKEMEDAQKKIMDMLKIVR